MDLRERIEQRLRDYIHPNAIAGEAQRDAFDDAVDAQLEFERQGGGDGIPSGASAFSIGDFSATLDLRARAAICADARAILRNAGLLRRELPEARRL